MPFDLALVDLFRPYLLRGEATEWHAVLSVIYVESYQTAVSPAGVTIRGVARFSGEIDPPAFDPTTGVLSAGAANIEGHPRNQPDRSEPWLDITDTKVEFAMTVPRAAGTIVATGVAGIPASNAAFQPVQDVLDALDSDPTDAPPSDYPNTGFVLDLVLSGIEFRPPFLQAAEMRPDGLLVPHSSRKDVVFHLPKVKLRLSQGSDAAAVLDVSLVSLGVSGLDDPGDMAAAELITMEPPYAFIGSSRVVGFAFRSAFLDLADGYTPPEILDQFGFDESWTGLYLPEIRIFFAPNGAEDFAVNAGVENFLIGLGSSSGITGDFDIAVINQGSGDLTVGARFFDREGRAIGITRQTGTTATAQLPATTRLIVDVVGGRAPYAVSVDQGSGSADGRAHDVDLSSATTRTITINVADASAPPKNRTLTVTASRRQAPQVAPPPGAVAPLAASIETDSITLEGQPQVAPRLRIVSDDRESVIVGLEMPTTPLATAWEVDGGSEGTGPTVTIPLAGGESKAVEAELPSENYTEINAYFRFDTPPKDDPVTYSLVAGNIRADQAITPSTTSGWKPPARLFLPTWREVLRRIAPGTATIEGTASHDGNDQKAEYNFLLSQRRTTGLEALIGSDAAIPTFGGAREPVPPMTPGWVTTWQSQDTDREQYWRARIRNFSVTIPGAVITGTVEREATAPPPPTTPPTRDDPPDEPSPPDWFRSARLKVRIVRDQFVALELSGSIDFQTGMENALSSNGASETPTLRGLGNNPSDGITDYLFLYQTDPASQTDEVKLYIGADPADKDGLLMTGQLPGQALEDPNEGRTMLGMVTVLTPLLAATAPSDPAEGAIVTLAVGGISAGVGAVLQNLGDPPLLNVERVILFGGEAAFRRQGDLWETSFLFDVETAISLNLAIGGSQPLIRIPRDKPLAVRYKAIGLKFGYPPGSGNAFEFRPVFDQSKGYTIDVSGPGAIEVVDPLGQILQVLGARIARTNPLNIEIDLGFAVDLGVVSVDRARVRLPIQPDFGPPELTAFGAGLKVPGVLEGKGYMEMSDNAGSMEIKGGIDVRLIPVKLRVAAQIAVAEIPEEEGGPATGVAVALEVELPVAIPLAQSGFGIYGFLGLFAMHYTRDEDGITSLTPALEWLKNRANGDPTNLQAWKPEIDRWAFGVGMTLGTMGSPVIFNVKGMFLLELPGPRVLLVVKANLLAVLPELKDKNAEGTFLCVIDLDFGRGTLTIGISIDFTIDPLVEIQIPIEAFFHLKNANLWHVYLGSFPGNDLQGNPLPGPIRASILGVFDGSGYVMISGHGIPSYQPPGNGLPALSSVEGVGLAVGLEVSIIWGNTAINLYLKVTAGFNAVLGFEPFYVGGLLYLRGELKLFIISLSASAALAVQVGQRSDGQQVSRIDGEVCGELDLFFFTIKGCVDFHLGEDDKILPPPPPLFSGTSLVSRSPALAMGSGVDRGIDSKIGDALVGDSAPAADDMTIVPIDAIPVLAMAMTPLDDGLTILGENPNGSPGAPAGGWVKRGDYSYRYTITEVSLQREGGGDPVMPGNTPSTWWTQNDSLDENLTVHLSLLNWTPSATPKALERSEFLEEIVTERWGTVCEDAAPAAAVLWTFHDEKLGASESGWDLDGRAWPDPPGTKRSVDADTRLHVRETWRTGDAELDRRRGLVPAIIEGGAVNCAPVPQRPTIEPDLDVTAGVPRGRGRNVDMRSLDELFAARPDVISAIRTSPLTGVAAARPTIGDFSVVGRRSGRAEALEPMRDRAAIGTDAIRAFETHPGARALRARELNLVREAVKGSFGNARGEALGTERVSVAEAIKRLNTGVTVDRSALFQGFANLERAAVGIAASTRNVNPDGPQCQGRVLASPLWDVGKPVVFGDLTQSEAVQAELEELGHKHGLLADVIRVDCGRIVAGHVLMWAHRSLLNKDSGPGQLLMIHWLDAADKVIEEQPIRVSDLAAVAGLPASWVDLSGPWFEDVYHAVLYGQMRAQPRQPLSVALKPPEDAEAFNIGVLYENDKEAIKFESLGRPFYVGAIELTGAGEVARSDYDSRQVQRNRDVLEEFLGPDSGDIALMFPGETYRVTARAAVRVKDDEGNEQDAPEQVQSFWFRTDADAPERLDPWTLCTLPAEDEAHVFGHEDIKLVFSTNNVDVLYAAYGKELRARLKAASFRQVDEPGVVHPTPIGPGTLENVAAHALSPFEAVLTDLLPQIGPCIPVDEDRVRHSMLTLPIPMDPYTDYVLDIESVDIGAPSDAVGDRVLRRSFSTGAFATLEDFVRDFQATLTEHRAVGPGLLQAIGADPRWLIRDPEGPEFDEALIGAGLEPLEAPRLSRIVVFWEQADHAAIPQPAAVLLDAPEPMKRTRPLPEEVTLTDPDGVDVTRWAITDQDWLVLDEAATSGNVVDTIVYAPGKQRALVTLKPGARGKVLHMDLTRIAFAEPFLDGAAATDQNFRVVSEALERAPWEES
jgi:hypothetical protein